MSIARFACSICGRRQDDNGLCPAHGLPLFDLHDLADRAELEALASVKGDISPVGHEKGDWRVEHALVVGLLMVMGVVSSMIGSGVWIGVEMLFYLVPVCLLALGYFVFSPRQRHARRLRRALRAVPAPVALIEAQDRVDRESDAMGSELLPASAEAPPPSWERRSRERFEKRRVTSAARNRHKGTGGFSMIK